MQKCTLEKCSTTYALIDRRCSQQLHAIANPSDEEVALPNSSITTKLLHNFNRLNPSDETMGKKKEIFFASKSFEMFEKCCYNQYFWRTSLVKNLIYWISKGNSSKWHLIRILLSIHFARMQMQNNIKNVYGEILRRNILKNECHLLHFRHKLLNIDYLLVWLWKQEFSL